MYKHVEIYCDGACSKNPGRGGWAAILIYKNHVKEISGYEEYTTNNRMELRACIEALKSLKEPCNVTLRTDSKYIVSAFEEGWIKKWKLNNWKNSEGDNVKNQDLWLELDKLCSIHNVKWVWIKGHACDIYNVRCDNLAVSAYKKNKSDF